MLRDETIEDLFKTMNGAIKQFKFDNPSQVHRIFHLEESIKICRLMPCQEAKFDCLEVVRKQINKYVREIEFERKHC